MKYRNLFSTAAVLLLLQAAYAQKPMLDTSAFYHWPSIRYDPALSSNGRFALYTIDNQPAGASTLAVCSTDGRWIATFPGASNGKFTTDGNYLLFSDSLQDLVIHRTGAKDAGRVIPGINTFQPFECAGTSVIACLGLDGDFQLLDPAGDSLGESHARVRTFKISDNGRAIVLVDSNGPKDREIRVGWLDVKDMQLRPVWSGNDVADVLFDDTGDRIAFKTSERISDTVCAALRYYKRGMTISELLAWEGSPGLAKGYRIGRLEAFTKDGAKLLFETNPPSPPAPRPGSFALDIWSYTDPLVQSDQLDQRNYELVSCLASAATSAPLDIKMLQQPEDGRMIFFDKEKGQKIVTDKMPGDGAEWNWATTARDHYRFFNAATGTHRELDGWRGMMSPDGRFMVYQAFGDFSRLFAFDSETGEKTEITRSLPVPFADDDNDDPQLDGKRIVWLSGWYADGRHVLLYDRYDLWKADLAAREAPICLTNGWGRKHHVVLRLLMRELEESIRDSTAYLLCGFDERSKDNGFLRLATEPGHDPEKLMMGPYAWYTPYNAFLGMIPIRAKDTSVYLVKRESAEESPNLFATTDFKRFTPLSSLYPEKNYNWLKSELIHFQTTQGKPEAGILYKPEDFDPAKKYPLILHYYQKRSDELHRYNADGPADGGDINIPWFVSHGYLVCLVDIDYIIGRTGHSALTSVEGAARWLMHFPWVDAKHLGIQGHSFGGFQTNYIVTHSHLFAAACSSSGMSDFVSNYLGFEVFHSNYDWYENRICRMGATLWEHPERYIENSPVFELHHITTPILTVANSKDLQVNYYQGREFFEGMRRLGKPIWMLDYNAGGHGVNGELQMDYLLRMTQFFDYYLKGARCPTWMAKGIPAVDKGVDDGFELEPAGTGPGRNILTPDAQRRVDGLLHNKPRTITLTF